MSCVAYTHQPSESRVGATRTRGAGGTGEGCRSGYGMLDAHLAAAIGTAP